MNFKDFDSWNTHKKEIHSKGENKFYRAGEIWWCTLGVNIGFEQDGSGNDGQRPILIPKGFSRQVCLVVPLTTSKKKNPYHISLGLVDNKQSFAIISQVRLIDTKRLINRVAVLEENILLETRKAIKDFL